MSWTIGTFAAAGEVGVETVRFYQRKGLLDTPGRGEGVRRYGEADLRRLRFIRKAQAAGPRWHPARSARRFPPG